MAVLYLHYFRFVDKKKESFGFEGLCFSVLCVFRIIPVCFLIGILV